MTIVLKGVHGTRSDNIKNIEKEGFKVPNHPGMKGTGIYFWEESIYAKDLAINWVKHRNRGSKEIGISVIYSDLELEGSEILEERDIHEIIAKNISAEQANEYRKPDKLGPLYNFMIKQLEKRTGSKFKVIIVKVGIPTADEYFSFYNMYLFGAPTTYIVREKEVIKITNIENLEH